MEIDIIIRELLAKQKYISLPELGSFVQEYEPAKLSLDGKTFNPPRQVIKFDTTRTFNDEAIENFIVEKLLIDHAKASNIVKEFTNNVKKDLKAGKEVTFINMGKLSQTKDGNIYFSQFSESDQATSTYGLNKIMVEPTIAEKTKPIVKEEKYQQKQPLPKTLPKKKTNVVNILAGVAAVIVVAGITTTFILIPELRFWNKPTQIALSKNDSTELNSPATILEDSSIKNEVVQPVDTNEIQKQKVDQTIKDKNEKKAALYYEEPKTQESKTYYLIVGSFGKIENAQKLSVKYSSKGYTPEIIQGNNMYRVSIIKTTDKNQAISDFNKFRTENPNEAVWVLGI